MVDLKDLKVTEQAKGMIEIEMGGNTMVMDRNSYDLANDLIALFKKTELRIIKASADHWGTSKNCDEQSRFLHKAAMLKRKR